MLVKHIILQAKPHISAAQNICFGAFDPALRDRVRYFGTIDDHEDQNWERTVFIPDPGSLDGSRLSDKSVAVSTVRVRVRPHRGVGRYNYDPACTMLMPMRAHRMYHGAPRCAMVGSEARPYQCHVRAMSEAAGGSCMQG